jgi:hypothetical protein
MTLLPMLDAFLYINVFSHLYEHFSVIFIYFLLLKQITIFLTFTPVHQLPE